MRKAIGIAVLGATLGAVFVFLAPSSADAQQVRVEGRFRLPHGDISIGVGDPYYGRGYGRVYYGSPYYPVGSYVPYGYRVIRRPRLGYGFQSRAFACRPHGGVYHSHWVPVARHRSRWIVVAQPVVVVPERPYYEDGYYGDGRYGYSRDGYSHDGYYDRPGYSDRGYYGDSRRRSRHVHSDACDHEY